MREAMNPRHGLALALVLAILVSLAPSLPSPFAAADHPTEIVSASGEATPDALLASARADGPLCTSLARQLRPLPAPLVAGSRDDRRGARRRTEIGAVADHRPRAEVRPFRRTPGSRSTSDSGDPL
jgi:hypothetical protein